MPAPTTDDALRTLGAVLPLQQFVPFPDLVMALAIEYPRLLLPQQWQTVGPIMAISGLFTFGRTGSILVDNVGRLGRIRGLAHQGRRRATVSGKAG